MSRAGGSSSVPYVGPIEETEEKEAEAPKAEPKPSAKKVLKEVPGDQKAEGQVLLKEEK